MGDKDLLARWVPIIQYDSMESYSADAVRTMTDCVPVGSRHGNLLRTADERTIASAAPRGSEPRLNPDFLKSDHYADPAKTAVSAGDYLDVDGKEYVADAHQMHIRPGCADQVYGHARRDRQGALWLQYWFFYFYNNKAFLFMGLHEGDWEMVQFRIGADEQPDVATYAQHRQGERAEWGEVETETVAGEPVPVVYSARGSHASYLRRGIYLQAPIVPDHNDAGGPRVRPQLNVITDESPSWVGWPGRWGSTRSVAGLIGADSPRGPRRANGTWYRPLAFHEAARPAEQLVAVAGAELPTPPAPEISAVRRADRAFISYRLAQPSAHAPTTTALLVSLDGREDGRAPATKPFPISRDRGELEFPLDLEGRSYTARAAAVGENGVTGPAASAEIRAASR